MFITQTNDFGSVIWKIEQHICDPPQEFDAKGESTRTTRLHNTLCVPQITDMRILNWKNKDGHNCLCFGKFNTLDLLFFCSVPYVTVSVRIIARLACNLGITETRPFKNVDRENANKLKMTLIQCQSRNPLGISLSWLLFLLRHPQHLPILR